MHEGAESRAHQEGSQDVLVAIGITVDDDLLPLDHQVTGRLPSP